jgi:preprotein translocase subunit SecA
MKKYIFDIKTECSNLESKTDEELNFCIEKLKKRTKNESLNNLIVPWFALVQEISYRKIGLKHYDTQLLAGLILHEGKIVEMKTGEGKTLASTLAVSLNALAGKGTHVVTVNEYLAERDQKWMGKIYNGLNLTVGLVKSENSLTEKKRSYNIHLQFIKFNLIILIILLGSFAHDS